ncbi:Secreted beta-glucosidase sun1 [Penicillium atrosanguineum]|uniref:Secreted beta-glucosidase sun1 n=1 Tax=Penicillium atrosanguineum TaxID=1132637 RepID=A0A9W9Q3F9_9EURO|nr:Secreted beta-glucosidase sun1 [Penicillium atrosanguineum]KAJ5323906.1 Secreted beta-glucosidase sun1 [Penicillium atrosanguineum]
MKFTNSVAVTLATAGSLAAAHGHGHAHFHKRATETETVAVPGPTVYDFVVMDPSATGSPEEISLSEACAGLADHKLEWLDAPIPAACPTSSSSSSSTSSSSSSSSTSTSTSSSSSTSTVTPTPTVAAQVLLETSAAIISSSSSSSSSTSTVESITSSSSSSTYSAAATSSSSSSSSTSAGLTAEFPDGELDCSTFPSDYGAVALDYLGIDGWSGIQYVTLVDELVSSIVTAVSGDSCTSGSMCSYACPPGYQKSQWPTTQGSTGQSVGGLECKGGKLYLTNTDYKQICIEGTGGVNIRNELSEQVAVCRTDYPGTESETVPLLAAAGASHPLTCPNGETYFKWEGKTTSAQYYVNNKGVSAEKGCQWGDGSEPIGNWAPMNFGVGYSAGSTWLSMFKNEPTTDADLDFKVKLIGDDLSDSCRYDGAGNFYNNAGKITSGNGCTASSSSGNAYFVFYD